MAISAQVWYCGSTKWTAMTGSPASSPVTVGTLVSNTTAGPAVGSERAFVCILAGAAGSTQSAWVVTKGAKTTDGVADAITSGTYTSGSGVVSLTLVSAHHLTVGSKFSITGTTGTGSFASCNVTNATAITGTTGSTLNYTIATGLATLTITGGASLSAPIWMECSGRSATNGDSTNTLTWTKLKSTSIALGQICIRASTNSYQICTTAGTTGSGSEPSFSDTAGVTTVDNTVTWTSLGAPSNFTAYAAPHYRTPNATSISMVASDTLYVSNNHAETSSASITMNPPGTTLLPCQVICVSDTVVPPTTLATTGSLSTTGAGTAISVSTANGAINYFYGLNFNAGNSSNITTITAGNISSGNNIFESCGFNITNTAASSSNGGSGINFNGLDEKSNLLINCTITFGATTQYLGNGNVNMGFVMMGGSIAATGSIPATLINVSASKIAFMRFKEVNLSQITGQLTNTGNGWTGGYAIFQNCSLGSGYTLVSGTLNKPYSPYAAIYNSDSGATNYNYNYQNLLGTVTDNTSIYRNNGATDGVTPISWEIVTGSSTTFYVPFVTEDIAMWYNASGSSLTASIELTTNSTLNNGNCWLEIEYESSSSTPVGSISTTRVTPLASTSTLSTSSKTWAGSAQTNKYVISNTFTPQMKGYIKARLYVAIPSATIYFDPYIEGIQATNRSSLIPGWGYNVDPAGAILSRKITGF